MNLNNVGCGSSNGVLHVIVDDAQSTPTESLLNNGFTEDAGVDVNANPSFCTICILYGMFSTSCTVIHR